MPSDHASNGQMRVLRIFHAGRNPAHRARDRALMAEGVEVIYVVPRVWPEFGSEQQLSPEPFRIIEVDVRLPGNVNGHSYVDPDEVIGLAAAHSVDLIDICEEPFSRAASQLIPRLPHDLPAVMYSAQNVDKRWPLPFRMYERRSLERVQGFYPCSRQAASVLRRIGFGGLVAPLPLGYDETDFTPGDQSLATGPLRLSLVGRMVPEKGVKDAVYVLSDLRSNRSVDAHLVLAGSGPEVEHALSLARELGVADHLEHLPWLGTPDLAALFRSTHVLLAPSRSTATWVEQFGRMVVEAQASGCVVVGYDSGSMAEVGGGPTRLVPEGDLDALARAVAISLSDENDFQSRRLSGQALAGQRTWSHVARSQVEFYRSAMARTPTPLVKTSPMSRMKAAQSEFGESARALGQRRPFALPGLRQPNVATKMLGQCIDLLAEVPHTFRRNA